MSRRLRQIPAGGSLVEVTCRTIQGRLLMRPFPLLNDVILGVLGRAQRFYELEIVAYSFLNHFHLLLRVDSGPAVGLHVLLQRQRGAEIVRLPGWKGRIWADCYDALLVTDKEEAHVKRSVASARSFRKQKRFWLVFLVRELSSLLKTSSSTEADQTYSLTWIIEGTNLRQWKRF